MTRQRFLDAMSQAAAMVSVAATEVPAPLAEPGVSA